MRKATRISHGTNSHRDNTKILISIQKKTAHIASSFTPSNLCLKRIFVSRTSVISAEGVPTQLCAFGRETTAFPTLYPHHFPLPPPPPFPIPTSTSSPDFTVSHSEVEIRLILGTNLNQHTGEGRGGGRRRGGGGGGANAPNFAYPRRPLPECCFDGPGSDLGRGGGGPIKPNPFAQPTGVRTMRERKKTAADNCQQAFLIYISLYILQRTAFFCFF